MIRVVIWNEFYHERKDKAVMKQYPHGIHEQLAQSLRQSPNLTIQCAWMDQPENGLPASILNSTDVLVWWSHLKNDAVDDSVADRIVQRIQAGMGAIFLHSSHLSKPFKRILGTSGDHPWRNKGEVEKIWNISPHHPITKGLPPMFELPKEEMYGEPFDVPPPQEFVCLSGFKDGSVFRSGLTWHRGQGRVFYFRPGHESYPTYHNPYILQILANDIS